MCLQPSVWRVLPWGLFAAVAGLVLLPAGGAAQPAVVTGKPAVLRDKLVVVSTRAQLYETLEAYPSKGRPVPYFSIFFKLPPKLKQPANLVRVGDSEGNEVGFIEKTGKGRVLGASGRYVDGTVPFVQDWDTRFVLFPLEARPGDKVVFRLDDVEVGGKKVLDTLAVPQTDRKQGYQRQAFVLKTVAEDRKDEDNTVFQVLLGTGPAPGERGPETGFMAEDVKLEIVFVLESSDFMVKTPPGGDKILLRYLQDLIRETVGELKRDPDLAKAIRLGMVQYWDNVPLRPGDPRKLTADHRKALEKLQGKFPAAVTCKLTDRPEEFQRQMDGLETVTMLDDWPDDVLAGLKAAADDVGWSKASIKHVILVGSASMQLEKEGVKVSQYSPAPENKFTNIDEILPRGFNSTGLSITQLIDRAQPAGGGVDRLFSQKLFHALFLPNERVDLRKQFPPLTAEKESRLLDGVKRLFRAKSDAEVDRLYGELRGAGYTAAMISQARRHYLVEHQASLARSQYERLTANRDGKKGIFREVKPAAADVGKAADELAARLKEAYQSLKKLRSEENVAQPRDNPLAEPIWQLNKILAEELKRKGAETVTGKAKMRLDGQEVAARKIFVTRNEMLRLHGLLRDLHARFTKLGGGRKDIKEVLNSLKESLGTAGLGQLGDKVEEQNLEQLINFLPMRSRAMKVTLDDVREMDPDTFARWLKQIDAAGKRCLTLHDNPDNWMRLFESEKSKDRYGFFSLSVLP